RRGTPADRPAPDRREHVLYDMNAAKLVDREDSLDGSLGFEHLVGDPRPIPLVVQGHLPSPLSVRRCAEGAECATMASSGPPLQRTAGGLTTAPGAGRVPFFMAMRLCLADDQRIDDQVR